MTLTALYSRYCRNSVRCFRQAQDHCQTDAIHDWRVSLRRIKVLWKLLDKSGIPMIPRSDRRTINRVFKAAGDLRDAQTQLALCERWEAALGESFPDFAVYLKQVESNHRVTFLRLARRYPLDAFLSIPREKRMALSRLPMAELSALLGERLAGIPALLRRAEKAEGEDIHRCRIRVKRLKYAVDIHGALTTPGLREKKMRKALSDLQDALGAWHDLEVHLALLRRFQRSQESHAGYPKLKAHVQNEQRKILEGVRIRPAVVTRRTPR